MKINISASDEAITVSEKDIALVFKKDGLYAYIPSEYNPDTNPIPEMVPKHIALGLMAMFVAENHEDFIDAIELSRVAMVATQMTEKIAEKHRQRQEAKNDAQLQQALEAVINSVSRKISEV
jgi:hypothetical protein